MVFALFGLRGSAVRTVLRQDLRSAMQLNFKGKKMARKTGVKVFAVVPARNEEKHVAGVVKAARKFVDEVIVVDDGSRDSTAETAKRAGAIVLSHPVNMGLGFSLRTGAEAALKLGADAIVTIDGDGQHDAEEIPKLLRALAAGNDVAIGTRHEKKDMPFLKRLGNRFIFEMQRVLFGSSVRDTQSGFRAFKASAWPKLCWNSWGYAVSSEIVKNVGLHKLRYAEVPIKTIYREEYKGTQVIDGLKIAITMVFWRLEEL